MGRNPATLRQIYCAQRMAYLVKKDFIFRTQQLFYWTRRIIMG